MPVFQQSRVRLLAVLVVCTGLCLFWLSLSCRVDKNAFNHPPHLPDCPQNSDHTFQRLALEDVSALHKKFVERPQDYYNTWQYKASNFSILGTYDPRNRDAPRIFALLDFQVWVERHNIRAKKMLVTDKNDPELSLLPGGAYVFEASFAQNPSLYDMHIMSLPVKDFDLVVFGQTLEHLYAPLVAMRNLHAHMSAGGYLFTSVPFVNIPHMTPVHFFHFSADGLLVLFHRAGFAVLELGCWGNLDYISKLYKDYTWPDVFQLATTKNDPTRPAQCWVLAQKPS